MYWDVDSRLLTSRPFFTHDNYFFLCSEKPTKMDTLIGNNLYPHKQKLLSQDTQMTTSWKYDSSTPYCITLQIL